MSLGTRRVVPLVAICVVTGFLEPGMAQTVPAYRVAKVQDVSMGAVRRLNIRVALPRHYARAEAVAVAKAAIADVTKKGRVNAVRSCSLDLPQTRTAPGMLAWSSGHPTVGGVTSGAVRAGDYASFQYNVTYRPPPAATKSALQSSGRRGLLGAPLPSGATLTERQAGNPAAGRDPSERYTLSASASEISAYFTREMVKAGWAKDGTSTQYALFFTKGNLMLGVLINGKGGTFVLMGS